MEYDWWRRLHCVAKGRVRDFGSMQLYKEKRGMALLVEELSSIILVYKISKLRYPCTRSVPGQPPACTKFVQNSISVLSRITTHMHQLWFRKMKRPNSPMLISPPRKRIGSLGREFRTGQRALAGFSEGQGHAIHGLILIHLTASQLIMPIFFRSSRNSLILSPLEHLRSVVDSNPGAVPSKMRGRNQG
jgi:hypothetical protein